MRWKFLDIEFTVFTPAYNRAHTLVNSYKALCSQTVKNFVWLIVDDGSTDNTKDLIASWKKENKIQIEYIYQKNAGKQRAVNNAVQNCKTKFFGFLDSDDYYCENTVEKFLDALHFIENNSEICGVMARRGKDEMSPIGSTNLPKGQFIDNYDHLVKKYHFYGDTCRAYKTEVLLNHLYPEIKDKFILEDVMLSAIDQNYDLLVINEVFSISEYLEDGYTRNCQALYRNNPLGYALGMSQLTVSKRGFLRKVKYTILFSVWCWRNEVKDSFKIVKNKPLYILLYLVSKTMYRLKIPKFYFEDI